jgi:membrane protein
LEVPIRLVRSVLFELTEARVLTEVYSDNREDVAYQPGCDIDRLTVASVIERLDQHGIDTVPITESPKLKRLRDTVRRFRDMNEQSPANLKLQEL